MLLELHIGVGNESVEIPLTSTHPLIFPSSMSSHSLSWLGASSQAPFQACNLVASLEVVSVFWCLHGISHGAAQVSEPESYLLIDQVLMEAQEMTLQNILSFSELALCGLIELVKLML